jgi:predicted phosphoadenosine phosphosulfate sulfurtransferase
MWDKLSKRVAGANMGARYGHSELMNAGHKGGDKLPGKDWPQTIAFYLNRHKANLRVRVAKRIKRYIKWHRKRTADPIPDNEPHPYTGLSWKMLVKLADRADAWNYRVWIASWRSKGMAPPPMEQLKEARKVASAKT